MGNKYLQAVGLTVFFVTGSLLFHREALDTWFIADDFVALFHSMASPRELFLDYRYSPAYYTPLALLSLKPDFFLFGLEPFYYHLHNVLIILGIAALFFVILRLSFGTAPSLFAAALVLFSLPSLITAYWIVLRQYLYPILFSLIVLYVFTHYRPSWRKNPLVTAGLLFLTELSFMGKEQFMTLPLLLLLFRRGSLRERLSNTLPYLILLILHFLLRIYVLKGLGGNVGTTFHLEPYVITILKSPFLASRVLFGHELFLLLIIVPVLIARPGKIPWLFLVWVSALGIQFLTLSSYPGIRDHRYWLVPSLLISSLVALGAESIKIPSLKTVYCLLIAGAFATNTFVHQKEIASYFRNESTFYKTVSRAMNDKTYSGTMVALFDDFPLERGYFLKMIDALHSEKLGEETYPIFIPADFLLFFPQFLSPPPARFYELTQTGINDISHQWKAKLEDYRSRFLPLSPDIAFTTDASKGRAVRIACAPAPERLLFYVITRRTVRANTAKMFYDRIELQYAAELPLKSFTKLSHAEIAKKDSIAFDGRERWTVDGRELNPFPSEALCFFSCKAADGKITSPTEILFLIQ